MNRTIRVFGPFTRPIARARLWPDAICECGTIVKRQNLLHHQQRKCHSTGTLPERCPHCDVQIYEMTPTHITLLGGENHLSICCGGTNTAASLSRNKYWRIVQWNRPILQRAPQRIVTDFVSEKSYFWRAVAVGGYIAAGLLAIVGFCWKYKTKME